MNRKTERKTTFPKSWNVIKSSKIPSKYHHSIWLKKDSIFHLQNIGNQNTLVISKHWYSLLTKKNHHIIFYFYFLFLFFWELKDRLSRFLKYHTSFVNTKERSSFYQLPVLKKVILYSQKSIISTFSLSKEFTIWALPFFYHEHYFCAKFMVL